jgi:hypothetical protein
MHPTLQELTALLDAERARLLAAWARIPADHRERRAAPDEWTPAEVLDHVRAVEAGSTRLLARRLARAREAGLGPETDTASRLGGLDHLALVDDPARYPAPEIIAPTPGAGAAAAEAGLTESRAALRALLAAADGLALGAVRATHLRFGELDMYQWLVFIAQHERRHAGQLDRLRTALAAAA